MRSLRLRAALYALMIGGLFATLETRAAAAEPLEAIGTFSLDGVTVGAPIFATSVSTTGGASGRPEFSDLSLTKAAHGSSPILVLLAASGKHSPEARVDLQLPGAKPSTLTLVLRNVVVNAVRLRSTPGSSAVLEDVSLTYTEVETTFTDGKGQTTRSCWDVIQNLAC